MRWKPSGLSLSPDIHANRIFTIFWDFSDYTYTTPESVKNFFSDPKFKFCKCDKKRKEIYPRSHRKEEEPFLQVMSALACLIPTLSEITHMFNQSQIFPFKSPWLERKMYPSELYFGPKSPEMQSEALRREELAVHWCVCTGQVWGSLVSIVSWGKDLPFLFSFYCFPKCHLAQRWTTAQFCSIGLVNNLWQCCILSGSRKPCKTLNYSHQTGHICWCSK